MKSVLFSLLYAYIIIYGILQSIKMGSLVIQSDSIPFFQSTNYRLPKTLQPISYNITISPEWTDIISTLPRIGDSFKGTVALIFIVLIDTSDIVLNNKGLRFTNVTLTENTDDITSSIFIIAPEWITYQDDDFEMVRINLRGLHNKSANASNQIQTTVLNQGAQYTLYIEYEGVIGQSFYGLYSSSYRDSNGKKHYIISTQFSPNFARRAFPCMDEPGFKALFTIAIDRPHALISLSNMPKDWTDISPISPTLKRDYFKTSVKMSTYLVAWVICDFEAITQTSQNGVKVSVYAPRDQIDQTAFAMHVAVNALNFYEEYFGILFPLPKLDLICIPNFAFGAMENWGLITYSMTDLLYKPNLTTESQKERIATVITHEMAHQWFGNLVTMLWWDDVWLKEGFATYMESICIDFIFKDWKMPEKFVFDTFAIATSLDSLNDSHALSSSPIVKPSDMQSMFDAIAYSKGALVIRMLDGLILPREVFRKGIQNYLHDNAYGNVQSTDLWKSLENAQKSLAVVIGQQKDNPSLETIMNTWIKQKGFPLVYISDPEPVMSTNSSNNQTPNLGLKIYQTKFSNQFTNESQDKSTTLWNIPLTIDSSIENTFPKVIWLDKKETTLPIPSNILNTSFDGYWIKANVKQFGYYSVKYGPSLNTALFQALCHNVNVITELDRAQLINDLKNLANFGYNSYTELLDFIVYINPTTFSKCPTDLDILQGEQASLPLIAILEILSNLYIKFRNYTDSLVPQKLLPTFIYDLVLNKLLARFEPWKNNSELSHLDSLLQVKTIELAVLLGHNSTVNRAKSIFKQSTHSTKQINLPYPDLSLAILKAVVLYGTKDDCWDLIWKSYKASQVPSQQLNYLNALASVTNLELVDRLLSYIRNGLYSTDPINYIKSQDMIKVLTALGTSSQSSIFLRIWQLITGEWNRFIEVLGKGTPALDRLVKAACQSFDSPELLKNYESFFDGFAQQGVISKRTFSQTREIIMTNIAFATKNNEAIIDWLKIINSRI